jgi:hypothetical protein
VYTLIVLLSPAATTTGIAVVVPAGVAAGTVGELPATVTVAVLLTAVGVNKTVFVLTPVKLYVKNVEEKLGDKVVPEGTASADSRALLELSEIVTLAS